MNLPPVLPPWLKYSRNNYSLIFDRDGNIKDCNKLFTSLSDADDKETINSFFSEDEIVKLWKLLHTLDAHTNSSVHLVSQQKNGNTYQWEFLLFNTDHIIGIAQQQNIIKRSTESIINVDHLIESFMNNSPASAWICDAEGRLLTMNQYYLNFTGHTTEDFGKTLWEIYPSHIAELYHKNNMIVLETNRILKTEELGISKSGAVRNFLVYKFPLNTIDHKMLVGGWGIDITERKEAEQKIFAHDLKIKELAFLQSHEVRRPLTNILGMIELIKAENLKFESENLQNILLYIQLSAKELDNEIKRVIDKLQDE